MSYGTNPLNRDTDGDGLNDKDELETYRTNPRLIDTDNDGLNDSQELTIGTNPTNPDTDNDGVIDGDDVEPLGDAAILVIIDYWEEKDSADFLTSGDPIFVVDIYMIARAII